MTEQEKDQHGIKVYVEMEDRCEKNYGFSKTEMYEDPFRNTTNS